MATKEAAEVLTVGGREVRVTNPSKPYFSKATKLSKLELVRYYLSVADGALAGIRDRPIVLKRFVDGAEGEAFYQKRAPENHPEWLRTVTLSFPSGRTAEEVVVDDAAGLAWIVNLGCIELHPHPVRAGDLDHPDELRVDLDPGPGVVWDDVRRVAVEVRGLLDELGLRGWPKTSGSRGMHVNVRIGPRWTFSEVRRAALALSREIERRAPTIATSKWWKEERRGVFLDYNQNAKDRTTCSAYSVRPLPDARVSAPLTWDEVPACEPGDFTVLTVPRIFAERGNPHAKMDEQPGSLEKLLELAARDEAAGLADAPWPPHFRKMEGEAPRVAPSRKKRVAEEEAGTAQAGEDVAQGSDAQQGSGAQRATDAQHGSGAQHSPHAQHGSGAPDATGAQHGSGAQRSPDAQHGSGAQHSPDAQRGSGAPDATGAQHGSGAQHSPHAQHGSGAPDATGAQHGSGAQHSPDAQHGSGASHATGAPHAPGATRASGAPHGSSAPHSPDAPHGSGASHGSGAPNATHAPHAPGAPRASRARRAARAPRAPREKMPLIVVANSPKKEPALAGLERWKARHPEVAALLAVDDVLVDSMRGRSSTWTRIRVNLRHVPEAQRPAPETPDPDDDPTREWRERYKARSRTPE